MKNLSFQLFSRKPYFITTIIPQNADFVKYKKSISVYAKRYNANCLFLFVHFAIFPLFSSASSCVFIFLKSILPHFPKVHIIPNIHWYISVLRL